MSKIQIPENLTQHIILVRETHFRNREPETEKYRVLMIGSSFICQWAPTAEAALEEASKVVSDFQKRQESAA